MITINIENFDLRQIAVSGQCFRMTELPESNEAVEVFQVLAGDKKVVATQERSRVSFDCDAATTQANPRISFDCNQAEFDGFWKHYFDLENDYAGFISSISPDDTYLQAAASACPGMRILNQDPWEMVVTFLISQQNNIPRIKKCVENIARVYGRRMEGYYAFPEAEVLAGLSEDALMDCNLGYRSKYVVRTARAIVAGRGTEKLEGDCFDLEACRVLPYEEAKKALLRLYGVGVKVADCICLFGFHQVDAFPIDTHIKQILAAHYKDGFPFEKYRGYAGILQQYMFYYDLHGEK